MSEPVKGNPKIDRKVQDFLKEAKEIYVNQKYLRGCSKSLCKAAQIVGQMLATKAGEYYDARQEQANASQSTAIKKLIQRLESLEGARTAALKLPSSKTTKAVLKLIRKSKAKKMKVVKAASSAIPVAVPTTTVVK